MGNLEMQVEMLVQLCTAEDEAARNRYRQKLRELGTRPASQADAETLVRQLLLEMGAPDHLLGHSYCIRAIVLMAENQNFLGNITFGLYPQLAAEFDTRPGRVERAIRHLVEVTWTHGDREVLGKYFGNTVSADRGKPTNAAFIVRMANVVKQKLTLPQ